MVRPLQGNARGVNGRGKWGRQLGEVKFKCSKGSIFHFDQVNIGLADGEPLKIAVGKVIKVSLRDLTDV